MKPSDVLAEILLNQKTPAQPFIGIFAATVAANATTTQADVTLDGFDSKNQATYTASFQPQFGAGSSAQTPPSGTKCLVAFTTPISYVAGTANVGVGTAVWVVAFKGWPS